MDFILGVDLDNVTADYTAGIAQFMHEEYGWREEDTPPPTDYDFIKAAGWPFSDRADFLQKHQEFVDRGLKSWRARQKPFTRWLPRA